MMWVAAMVIAVDQLTKGWATDYQINTGLSATPLEVSPFLRVVGLTVLLLIVMLATDAPQWAIGLMVGGGVSNAADHVLYGGARDFLPGPGVPGYLLEINLADMAVVVGLAGWVLSSRRKEVAR